MNDTLAITKKVSPRRLVRWMLVIAGVACVGVGAAGVVIPGLPTTVFLLLATWCFTKSCPWLEQRLIRNRFFSPFLCYLDRTAPMPRRARITAIALMWLFVGGAIATLAWREVGPPWMRMALACAAVIGTVVVVRWDASLRRGQTSD